MEVDKVGADEMGIDEMGSRRRVNKPGAHPTVRMPKAGLLSTGLTSCL